MINEKILIKTIKKWQSDSSAYAGLKEPALLQKVIDEVEHMATDAAEKKLTATDLICKARHEFCSKFCKYTEECWQDLDDKLRECPLDIL